MFSPYFAWFESLVSQVAVISTSFFGEILSRGSSVDLTDGRAIRSRMPPRILRCVVNVRQGQFEAALNVLGYQVAGNLGVAFLEGFENCAMNLICLFQQLAIMAETFDAKNSGMNMTVAGELGESRIAGSFDDRHVKR